MKSKRQFQSTVYWQQHIQAWADSGLSQKAYCTGQQIAPSTFYKWRRKLQVSLPVMKGSVPMPSEETTPSFIEVSAVPDQDINEQGKYWDIELQLGPEILLRMSQR